MAAHWQAVACTCKAFVMAKSTNRKTPPSLRSLAHTPSANVTEYDIARRAYDLYLARDREDGHDVDDWLQAERELQGEEHP